MKGQLDALGDHSTIMQRNFQFCNVRIITLCNVGGKTNFISSEICTCTNRGQTPELKITLGLGKGKSYTIGGKQKHEMKQ